jgi:hypothetical protein
MPWRKRGQIVIPPIARAWSVSHAQCPTPWRVDNATIRIYFGTRDAANRTRTTFIDVDAAQPERVIYVHDQPVMELGALGCFDDAGVMPSCVLSDGDRLLMYYAGWNTSTTVPYRISIGVAESDDGGRTFRRMFDGPILDRTTHEPHFCSTPFVLRDGDLYRMWYLSCVGWNEIGGRAEPRYFIRQAQSQDGIEWQRQSAPALNVTTPDECLARPWVCRWGNLWKMWYCRRSRHGYRTDKSKSYRIGYAESTDGVTWQRRDEQGGLGVSPTGWDSEMTAYPAIYEHQRTLHLLYNGNGFGASGFGCATTTRDDLGAA